MQKNIYLCGFMCAGKTTCGKELSSLLNKKFIDTDLYLEKENNKSITQLIAEKGFTEFRKEEFKLIKKISSQSDNVVSLGGGIYPNAKYQKLFKNGIVVFINTRFETILSRLPAVINNLPKLKNNETVLISAKKLYNKRLRFYLRANLIADVCDEPAEIVAKKIVYLLNKVDNYENIQL